MSNSFRIYSLALGMATIGGAHMNAQVSAAMPSSPHKNILIVPLKQEAASYPNGIQGNQIPVLYNNTFVIHNNDSRNVIGLFVVWHITDSAGIVSTRKMMMDTFLNTTKSTIIAPTGTMIISPAGSQLAGALTPSVSQTPGPTPGLSHLEERFEHASQISLTIDSVMFEDGEIWGPNTEQIDKQIVARKAAAVALSQLAKSMIANGGDWKAQLTAVKKTPVRTDDVQSRWQERFTQQLLHWQGDPKAILNYFDQLPSPMTFSAHQYK
ncbi:hypothetical protein EDE15_4243 [Edaphobacter aggregans]|uniref:Uncharacterized protein n=1 Tax=Edaphobacter aggregans TaxID=570835 RepID=A0A428MP16_9BACT|nr:hypothetical protein [Edaphobacter aggregans]RSL18651.1 hypothetical protein EDE15_4243 [Edaphobacter aggregans]